MSSRCVRTTVAVTAVVRLVTLAVAQPGEYDLELKSWHTKK